MTGQNVISSDGGNDETTKEKGVLKSLFRRMNPRSCLHGASYGSPIPNRWKRRQRGFDNGSQSCGCGMDDDATHMTSLREIYNFNNDDDDAPDMMDLLQTVESNNEVTKLGALKRLYELTRKRPHLRVPIVCTTAWNIISLLSSSLNTTSDEIRRTACLVLNNLSIPYENKAVMVFGQSGQDLLDSLVSIIRLRLPEAYLCCICLMNLTFLEDAVLPIFDYSPLAILAAKRKQEQKDDEKGTRPYRRNSMSQQWNSTVSPSTSSSTTPNQYHYLPQYPLGDPNSLLRTIESLLQTHSPFCLYSKHASAETEAVRWSVGLLRNLTKENNTYCCSTISKTEIPFLIHALVIQEETTPKIQQGEKKEEEEKVQEDSIKEMGLLVLSRLASMSNDDT